jgi:hypothetical protein
METRVYCPPVAYGDWIGMLGHTLVMAGMVVVALFVAMIARACIWVVARVGLMVKHLVRRAP